MTILTVLGQKVIASYEHVIALLARQYYRLRGVGEESIPVWLRVYGEEVEMGEEGEDEERLQLKEYEVEKCEDPCLFSGLATLQLEILRVFLVRSKGAPEDLVGEYFSLLDSMDKSVMKLGRYL
jgi:hypothetical protein